jgi:SAM-dependent methyltransferase
MRRVLKLALIGPGAWSLLLAAGSIVTPARAELPAGRAAASAAQDKPEKEPDVIFVPTPPEVVARMMEMAGVKKGDVHYDLGCGDGRVVVAAAKRGARSVGIDIDPKRIKESTENVKRSGVGDRATIKRGDIFEADIADADVVTLYLLPELNVRLMPKLKKLKPGTRIVSHDFDMRGAKPRMVATVRVDDDEEEHTVYLWVVPWEDE